MKLILSLAAVAAAALACTPAMAQDGDDYRFVLVNSSAVSAIEFVTMRKNGSWSSIG